LSFEGKNMKKGREKKEKIKKQERKRENGKQIGKINAK
jgi:hypothetical protein